jgi:hypothetical protein
MTLLASAAAFEQGSDLCVAWRRRRSGTFSGQYDEAAELID